MGMRGAFGETCHSFDFDLGGALIRRLVATGALAVAAIMGTAASASAVTVSTTELEGENEVPVLGDLDGGGYSTVIAIPEAGLVCYVIVVFDIGAANAAHIHEAPKGVAGPVVVGLEAPTRGASGGCIVNPGEAADIAADPEDYYVNVHNTEFPGGAVRGQLD